MNIDFINRILKSNSYWNDLTDTEKYKLINDYLKGKEYQKILLEDDFVYKILPVYENPDGIDSEVITKLNINFDEINYGLIDYPFKNEDNTFIVKNTEIYDNTDSYLLTEDSLNDYGVYDIFSESVLNKHLIDEFSKIAEDINNYYLYNYSVNRNDYQDITDTDKLLKTSKIYSINISEDTSTRLLTADFMINNIEDQLTPKIFSPVSDMQSEGYIDITEGLIKNIPTKIEKQITDSSTEYFDDV